MQGAVPLAYSYVRVKFRFPLIKSHVADQRRNLDLLFDLDRQIFFGLKIKVANGHIAAGPDGHETAKSKLLLFSKLEQQRSNLIARVEDQEELSTFTLTQKPVFHCLPHCWSLAGARLLPLLLRHGFDRQSRAFPRVKAAE